MFQSAVRMIAIPLLLLVGTLQVSDAIINGKAAEEGEFPFAVALFYRGRFACTGSLIAPTVVLTAGHCVNKKHGPDAVPENFTGVVGTVNKDSNTATKISFIKAIAHPYFKRGGGYVQNDIAILIASEPVVLNEHTKTICISGDKSDLKQTEDVTALGWGRIYPSRHIHPSILRYVTLLRLTSKACAMVLNEDYRIPKDFAERSYICVTDSIEAQKEGLLTGTCFGDSGGPLVSQVNGEYVQVGITSYGDGHQCHHTDAFFTRVSEHLHFIKNQAGDDAANICIKE